MSTKFEGILIHKTPYRHRDVVGKILLRSGDVVSVLFYGGAGGGKKQKSSLLELGHMLKIESARKKPSAGLFTATEWSLIWRHELVRGRHEAFYLMCLYLEFIGLVSPEYSEERSGDSNEGLFSVLSNSIFSLEQRLAAGGVGPAV